MNDTMYLLDNNVLGPLGDKRRKSAFFREHCRVPAEVAFESRRAKHAGLLAPLAIDVTPSMLAQLAVVMNTVQVGDTSLVDLYNNKGAADPILVAVAYVLNNPELPTLMDPTWVIVSRDKAVRTKASEFAIEVKSPDEFAQIIDLAESA